MNKYVALFRGLNVGGHNKITMVDLKAMLEGAACQKVTTYIQSGNAVFESEIAANKIETHLEDAFEKQFGYAVEVMVRSDAQLQTAYDNFPFFDEDRELRFMMTGFAKSDFATEAEAVLKDVADGDELVQIVGNQVHFYFANGSGRSKLGALNFAKKIGTPLTLRNRRTVGKLLELINAL